MITKVVFSILFLLPLIGFAQVKADDIVGVYLTEIKDAKIQVYKKNDRYFGRIIWMESPLDENGKAQLDKQNPVKSLQIRPVYNMDILTNLKFDKGTWSGGEVYDPKSGDTYTCKVWLEGNTLKVRGYLGWLFATKTWTKSSV